MPIILPFTSYDAQNTVALASEQKMVTLVPLAVLLALMIWVLLSIFCHTAVTIMLPVTLCDAPTAYSFPAILHALNFLPSGDLSIGKWLQELFILAVRMTIPFYCALVLSDIGLGFLARTVPQMNIFVVGLPVKVMLGFMVLAVALPLAMDFIFTKFEHWIEFALAVLFNWK